MTIFCTAMPIRRGSYRLGGRTASDRTFGATDQAKIVTKDVIPLDRMMEALNGLVIRGPKFGDDERRVRESSARRTEIEQLESEHESADEDGKGRLRRKIEELRVRLERRLEVDHLWRERILEEMRVRAQGLKSPAAKS
jgi:hypothetical protein